MFHSDESFDVFLISFLFQLEAFITSSLDDVFPFISITNRANSTNDKIIVKGTVQHREASVNSEV